MTLLHTEYYCDDCRRTFLREQSKEHKWETGHLITKKIIYPSEQFEDEPQVKIETSKPVEFKPAIDFCIDCSKEVLAPALHKSMAHMVFKKVN